MRVLAFFVILTLMAMARSVYLTHSFSKKPLLKAKQNQHATVERIRFNAHPQANACHYLINATV